MVQFQALFLIILGILRYTNGYVPIVMNTWAGPFTKATERVWKKMQLIDLNAKDAVTLACIACEEFQCENTVGYGGSPDENGETTLDALIFDGAAMDMGAVAGLRRIRNAIAVARHVLENTKHSLLSGDLATEFATRFGFKEESLTTNYSKSVWNTWKNDSCQPNFWKNVLPDPSESCGPYYDTSENDIERNRVKSHFDSHNHDTIGAIAIDDKYNIVAGTSTNGANHKIPGRVGDSPIPGAGAYADNSVGAAVATGDGDVMMRFLPSFLAVEELRRGSSPTDAASVAIKRIAEKYPSFFGAVLVANKKGEFGAACNGMTEFPFSVASKKLGGVVVKSVKCI